MTFSIARHRRNDARRRAIAADLAAYTTPADRLELAAILDRHDDTDSAEIRNLIDLTRAA